MDKPVDDSVTHIVPVRSIRVQATRVERDPACAPVVLTEAPNMVLDMVALFSVGLRT